ncbi:MAG: fimbrillin family protein [Bacteroidales bacterium]|nr:fimbrillin family protein [Bacteroidales bacterium]
MRTRLSTIILACAAIAGAAMVSGCSKSPFRLSGQAINFTTRAGGSASTKTAYGTDQEKEIDGVKRNFQALDWVTGDVITIASPQAVVQNDADEAHASNYVVTVKTKGVPSTGSVQNESANGLMWTDKESYDFYAVYPKTREGLTLNYTDGKVTATIPAEQELTGETTTKDVTTGKGEDAVTITYKVYQPDMQYAYMTAVAKGVTETDEAGAVELEFNPAFTAFEFNVSSIDDEPIELTEFELLSPEGRSDKISGSFTMTAGQLSTAAVSAGTQSVKVAMDETVKETEGLSFTVFTLPVVNTDALRIRFTSKDGEDATKTSWIDLKYSDDAEKARDNAGKALTFQPGHKYRINMLKLPSSQWKISIVAVFEDWVDAEEEVIIYI